MARPMPFNRVALGHAGADAALQGGLALGAVHEVFAEGQQSGSGDRVHRGLAGRRGGAPAAGLGAAGFFRN